MAIAVIISPGSIACSRSGVVAGQQEEIVDRDLALAEMNDRIEGDQRDGEIAGIGGDAGLAGAEHGVAAV